MGFFTLMYRYISCTVAQRHILVSCPHGSCKISNTPRLVSAPDYARSRFGDDVKPQNNQRFRSYNIWLLSSHLLSTLFERNCICISFFHHAIISLMPYSNIDRRKHKSFVLCVFACLWTSRAARWWFIRYSFDCSLWWSGLQSFTWAPEVPARHITNRRKQHYWRKSRRSFH